MQTYDLLMLAVLAGATLFGWWKGLAWQIASLASILVSYGVALNFRGLIASKLGLQPPLDAAASMLILYCGSSLAVWIGFGFVSKSLKEMKLKDWDHQIGALVGAAKGVLFCMLITIFAMTLGPKTWQEAIPKSTSGRYIGAALTQTELLLPKEIHQQIAKYIDPVKNQLGSGNADGGVGDFFSKMTQSSANGASSSSQSESGNLLDSALKAGEELFTKTKQDVGAKIESELKDQVQKGAENTLRDFGKSVTDRLGLSEGSSPSQPNPATGSTGQSTPRSASQNDPGDDSLSDPAASPLGIPRSQSAGRPSVRMPDFSSKRWQRK